MSQVLLIKKTLCITPLRSRVDAIQRLEPPKTPKEYRMLICPYLKNFQKRIILIYNFTRKGVPFESTEEHQKTFEDIKMDTLNPPVLFMPNNKGPFTLVSDTSGVTCGTALYQEQRDRLALVGYNSKEITSSRQLGTVLVNLKYVDWQSIYIVSSI